MEKNLVIVTGGARGIGRAIAEKLVQEGYAVAITYTSSSTRADEVVSRLQGEGGRIRACQADVTNPALDYPAHAEARMIRVDVTWMARNRARILAEWTRRYGAKAGRPAAPAP